MDKSTLSNYGWIVICILVISVMLALATPFGTYISNAVKSTTQGLFNAQKEAFSVVGVNMSNQEFTDNENTNTNNGEDIIPDDGTKEEEKEEPREEGPCIHKYEVTATATCENGGTVTYKCVHCGYTYEDIVDAYHTFTYPEDVECDECGETFITYTFTASDYDRKMGTTTQTDANVNIPPTFEYNGLKYKVVAIGASAFSFKQKLQTINIPDTVTEIGAYAFWGSTSLTNITIHEGIEMIGIACFFNCSLLTEVKLPDTTIIAGDYMFNNCASMKTVKISKNTTTIGAYAFSGCTILEEIFIPATVTSIGNYAFTNCTSLETFVFGGTMEQWNAITFGYGWNNDLKATKIICSDGEIAL